jgi:hypothetical protein
MAQCGAAATLIAVTAGGYGGLPRSAPAAPSTIVVGGMAP